MAPVAATPSSRREPQWVPLRVVPPPPLVRGMYLPAVRPPLSVLEGGGGGVCGGEGGGSRSGGGVGGASGGGGQATTYLMAYTAVARAASTAHPSWPPPTRTSPYLMLYTVLRPHQPQLHLLAVRPPLYPLLWLQAVARAAPLARR
jgi:hypothetical protein